MYLSLFLHLYQPPTQFPEVLDKIVRESYDPLLTILENNPQARITVNLAASLVEQLSINYQELLTRFKELVLRGQVELTGTAAYHPLLVWLPRDLIRRQILIHENTLNQYFGVVGPTLRNSKTEIVNSNSGGVDPALGEIQRSLLGSQGDSLLREDPTLLESDPNASNLDPGTTGRILKGFFPPEMAVNQKVLGTVRNCGYQYILTDDSALVNPDSTGSVERIFIDCETGITAVCRHRSLSLDIAFSKIRTLEDFFQAVRNLKIQRYVVLAIDGETFGHHRPEQINFLSSLLSINSTQSRLTDGCKLVCVSDLIRKAPAYSTVKIATSTWAESFNRWRNPRNKIHQLQWQLTNLAIKSVSNLRETQKTRKVSASVESEDQNVRSSGLSDSLSSSESSGSGEKARYLLDRALHSDQYWWASRNPCWHYQMVERGARLLLEAVQSLPEGEGLLREKKCQAEELYRRITSVSLKLYGDTVVAC